MTGLVITLIGLLFLDEIIRGLGASEILFPCCRDYLTIQLVFAVGNIMQVLYQNLFVTAGRPTLGLIFSVLAGLAHIAFEYISIALLHMGIKGARSSGRSELYFYKPEMDAAALVKELFEWCV